MESLSYIGVLSIAVWAGLLLFHGGYWRLRERLPDSVPAPPNWPSVAVIIPARNEADLIGETVTRMEAQVYPGELRIIVVNDQSDDQTADVAAAAAGSRTSIILAEPRPDGWMGKVWAMEQGLRHLSDKGEQPDFILFTDADIHHPANSVERLAGFAIADGRDLVSLMVKLKVQTLWERLLIPAFVLFFSKLYPFARVNDPQSSVAAAAGGCMLVRRSVLDRAELMTSIRGELIDDCALARAVSRAGAGQIWLGLTDDVISARPYGGLWGVWDMVARTAFTQLRFSPLLLVGSVLGMLFLYFGWVFAALIDIRLSVAGLALITASFLPALKLYRQPSGLMLLLPLAGLMYTAMTVDSALRHWRGQGGNWKGRYQAKGTH